MKTHKQNSYNFHGLVHDTKETRPKHYRFCLLKSYFEQGYGMTNYIKYMIALFGITSQAISTTLIIALCWAVSCFFLGWAWFRYGFMEAQKEVENQFDWFVREMRKKRKV